MPPPTAASWLASRRMPCTRDQRPSRTTHTIATPSNAAATTSSGATPISSTRLRVMSGPAIAPAVPPSAMTGNRRRACCWSQMSAMKLQNTDAANRLNTLTQTKNTAPSARGLNKPVHREQRHECQQAGDEERIHQRHHDRSRPARHQRGEHRRQCQRRDEGRGIEPGQLGRTDRGRQLLAHRTHHVIPGQHAEEEHERQRDRIHLAAVYPPTGPVRHAAHGSRSPTRPP